MKDINDIFREQPSEKLWNRLEERLDKKKDIKKIRFYRIASAAAILVAVVASVSYFNHILEDHNPQLFASNEGFSAFVLEEISNDDPGLFNMAFFDDIRQAYGKNKADEALSLSGDYVGVNGEISLDIELIDFTYFLSLSYDGFPTLELTQVNGQTLYFNSPDDKFIKLNVEPYGLQLIESNLLPEYKGYQFNRLKEL